MSGIIEQQRFTCALAAQQTVLAIPRGIPIIHAGPGCSTKAFSFASAGAGMQGGGYAGGHEISCTNAGEAEVVFGGEKKLDSLIDGTLRVIDGDLYVVLTGCTSDIVGDDTLNVAQGYALEGHPVVAVETAGFKGSNYLGHEFVLNAIIEQFVGDVVPQVRQGLVNVFSVVPFQDPFWRSDLETIKELLQLLGFEVNILFGSRSRGISEWKDIPHAQFNLLLSPWVGLGVVELLEQKYGTPFVHYPVLPVGAEETSRFLRVVGQFGNIPQEKVEAVIAEEEQRYYDYFSAAAEPLTEFIDFLPADFFLVADSVYALGISNFLVHEMGYEPQGIYIIDDPSESKQELVRTSFHGILPEFDKRIFFEPNGALIGEDIQRRLVYKSRSWIFGSTWERFLAEDTGNIYVFTSIPINADVIITRGYAGYDGGLRLIEELFSQAFQGRAVTSGVRNSSDQAVPVAVATAQEAE
ncbi:nitrogenase component 1 [Treponema primitia]|uniref:nitrogenase component 1 n=1 Tax=Treponema primitia TaxID=88058 RepID=UPI00025554CD|nr:nitrogenase component 1 [Treponema primitia]